LYYQSIGTIASACIQYALLAAKGGERMKKPLSKKAQSKEAAFWEKMKQRMENPGKMCLK